MSANYTDSPPIEIELGESVQHSIIWLHGLGADGHDFEPIVPELGLGPQAQVRFVFPHAPRRAITINGGMVMRAWYDIYPASIGFEGNAEQIRAAAAYLQGLIEQEHARGIAYEHIFLAGFSQGGAIALHAALRFPNRLAGVLALSTYLPLADSVAGERHASNAELPMFMAHGEQDPLIPLQWAEHSKQQLQQLGIQPNWHVYPMQHSVCVQEISDIAAWLRGHGIGV